MNTERLEALLLKARLLPLSPGVYKMLDKNQKVIYVGKSKALKNRVSQYFQAVDSHPPKTMKMVQQVYDFECVFTDTETESLVLENELIKLYSPKFNIRLKDDKSYPYIKLSTSEDFPRLSMVRSLQASRNKADLYFGPYSSSTAVYNIIDTANKLFLLPSCKLKFPEDFGKKRPCLNYHIGKCCGLCKGDISREEYASTIKALVSFLKSDYEEVISSLEVKMQSAAEDLNFESAVTYRDLINSIKNLRQKQKILFADRVERDIFGIYFDDISSCISVTIVREGRIIDSERFVFTSDEIMNSDAFEHFMVEYYAKRDYIPREIIIPYEMFSESIEDLVKYFASKQSRNIKILHPEKGEQRKAVVMANANAKEYALHQRKIEEVADEKLIELASLLGLEVVPERIEAYDISNSSDKFTTAGMICIKNGKFSKRDYRLFNIQSVSLDDYGAMTEALTRRIGRYTEEINNSGSSENWTLPDLFLIDGGAGHVSVVQSVLEKHSLSVPVFGMVKDEHHKTRTLTDGINEISIAHNMKIFNFIYGIQEEVHRFTFSSMDKKRRKSVSVLSLENVSGIGPKKAKILLGAFKSIKNLKNAHIEDIAKVKGISLKDAENIKRYFENDN